MLRFSKEPVFRPVRKAVTAIGVIATLPIVYIYGYHNGSNSEIRRQKADQAVLIARACLYNTNMQIHISGPSNTFAVIEDGNLLVRRTPKQALKSPEPLQLLCELGRP